jgi:hypothetical protein
MTNDRITWGRVSQRKNLLDVATSLREDGFEAAARFAMPVLLDY